MTDRDPIHALLEEAAEHTTRRADALLHHSGIAICGACFSEFPCLVTRLAAEVHHLRKELRDQTPCVCG